MDIERIYEEHFVAVYRYVLSLSKNQYIAEEITQETFFKALKYAEQFRGECRLSVWLCQIAKNTYLGYLEKEKKLVPSEKIPEQISFADEKGLEQGFVEKETARRLHQFIHDMDEPYKEVFSLRTFSELAFAEIGTLFGKSESWARVTYHRAKLKLKEAMEREDNL